eukprot:558032_1
MVCVSRKRGMMLSRTTGSSDLSLSSTSVMSMNEAIQFRHLITQLTHQERIGFLSKLVGSHIDMILTCLFKHLSKSNQTDEVNVFNKQLSDIIQSRKDKPAPLCMQNIKLDQFPRAIIGYTASFLDQDDYIHFSISNRSTYLGCNSPNTLQKLNLENINNYSSINPATFVSLKCLCMDPSKAIHFASQRFNQVQTLRLSANNKRGWVQSFFNQNVVSCNNITTLCCSSFGDVSTKMEGNEFLSLLTKLGNLAHLKMNNVYATENITGQDIADACPKVVGLELRHGTTRVNKQLPRIFANQLKYLSLRQQEKNAFAIDLDNIGFDKLEELTLMWPQNELCVDILKSALHLKRIFISYWEDWMKNDEIQNVIANCIMKCASLSYIGFSILSSHFCSVLEGIERGLFKTKKQHRKQFKICIYVRDEDIRANDFTFYVARIVNSLEACDINDFMLIWELKRRNDDETSSIYMDLCNISMDSKVSHDADKHQSQFIIANRNCKINGYHTSFVLGNERTC